MTANRYLQLRFLFCPNVLDFRSDMPRQLGAGKVSEILLRQAAIRVFLFKLLFVGRAIPRPEIGDTDSARVSRCHQGQSLSST